MKNLFICILCFGLCGCAGTPNPGTKAWHNQRYEEIQTAYDNREISKAEYIQLKNQADQTRASLIGSIVEGAMSK